MDTLLEDLRPAPPADDAAGDVRVASDAAQRPEHGFARRRLLYDSERRCRRLCMLLRLRKETYLSSTAVDQVSLNLVTALKVEMGFLERESENAPAGLLMRITSARELAESCLEAASRHIR